MSTISWKLNGDGDWSTMSNWTESGPATSADAVVLSTTTPHTVTHSSGSDTVVSIAATTDHLTVVGGSLTVMKTASFAAGLTESGGSVTFVGNASVAGGFVQTGGTVAVGGGSTLALSGNTTLSGGGFTGTGTLSTTGTTTLATNTLGRLMSWDSGLSWANSGVVSDAASLFLNFPTGSGVVTISNSATGAFDLTGNGAAIYNDGVDATFSNAGTLSKISGAGTSNIYAAVVNTGTMTASSGILELDDGGILGGTIGATQTGSLAFGLGTFTLGGATQTITGALALNGGTIALAQGQVLTLSGAVDMTVGGIDGPGTLVTTGATAVSGVIDMDGSLAWTNSGTVSDLGEFDLDYPSGAGLVAITNAATGVFDFTQDGWGLYNAAGSASFANAGTLAKVAGVGTSNVFAAVSTTGTLTASKGTLELDAGGTLGGTIGATQSGTLAFGYGTFTLAAAAQTITGALAVTGGTLSIAQGDTLTLSGAVTLTAGGIDGPGTLVTTGKTTVNGPFALDGSLSWANSGTVIDSGQINLDYPSDTGAVTITNVSKSVFDLAADGNSIFNFGTSATFANAGTLSKTTGNGTSALSIYLANTGKLTATTGTIELDGGGKLGGTIGATKTGAIAFATGTFTLATTTQTITGAVTIDGATLSLTSGRALTLSGAVTFSSGAITGAGILTTTGTLLSTATGNTISTLVTNGGAIDVAARTTLALTGGLSGSGIVTIESGAVLEVGKTLAAGQSLIFLGNGATLRLDVPASVSTPMQGFGVGNSIDLAGVAITGASITTKTLSLSTGTTTYKFLASTSLAGDRAQVLPDGTGGTIVTLYAAAVAAVHTPQPVAFGKLHVGDVAVKTLTVSNRAVVGPYTEKLDGSLTAVTTGFTTAGTITGLVAGGSDNTTLTITANTTKAGVLSGSTKLGLETDGTGIDGLGKLALPSQAVTMSGSVYAYAAPTLSATTLALAARVGGTLSGSVTLADGTTTSLYQESLLYAASGAKAFTITGGSGTIAAGGTGKLSVTLSSATAGTTSNAVTIGLTSTGVGTSGLANTALASQTVTVNTKVYALAVAKPAATTVNVGIVHVGDAVTASLAVTNAGTGGLVDLLTGGTSTTKGSVSSVATTLGTGIASGASGSVTLAIGTSAAGTVSGSAVLGFTSHDTDLADKAISGGTVTVTGTVDNYALSVVELVSGAGTLAHATSKAYVLNLGTVAQNGAALTSKLGVVNAASGPADLLAGAFTVSGASAFTNTGLTSFSGLGAGADERSQTVSLATGTAGIFTETIVLTPTGSNASGYTGALASETITVTGTVVAAVGTTTALPKTATTLVGTAGNDIVSAITNTLVLRDSIDGGGGTNTLTLLGGGTFNLALPKTLANIQQVTAQESTAGTTVTMRAGLGVTLTVAPAGSGSITIHGAADTDVFNLGGASDTVVLGSAAETVHAGGGTALVQATAAQAGALVTGGSTGTTTLEVTTGGTATLDAADTHLNVTLDAATNLGLGAATFITAVGSSAFGDSFINTAAGFAGDTIKAFGGSDTIDITDLVFKTFKTLAYTGATGSGTLVATDGTHSAAMKMTGSYIVADFTHAADGHGGTLIGFVQH